MAFKTFTSPNYVEPPPRKRKPPIAVRSRKAKARRLQDEFRDGLRKIGVKLGFEDGDIKGAIMGISGVDIKFSPAASKVFKLDVECKFVERLKVVRSFFEHYKKYEKSSNTKVLVHKVSHKDSLITMRLEDFLPLYEKAVLGGVVPGRAVGEHDVP